MSKSALIIFVRNPEKGKVKTRIAATAGDDVALNIYKKLLEHTYKITADLSLEKFVYYDGFIGENDVWSSGGFKPRLQHNSSDLGERMKHAFENTFAEGYSHVCIIGSDCIGLTGAQLQDAFLQLDSTDIVIGPSLDGGYYLLGMKKLYPFLFENKIWSTDKVASDTLDDAVRHSLSYILLQPLSDIDTMEDWLQYQP